MCVHLSLRVDVWSQPVGAGSLSIHRVYPGELNLSRQVSRECLPAEIPSWFHFLTFYSRIYMRQKGSLQVWRSKGLSWTFFVYLKKINFWCNHGKRILKITSFHPFFICLGWLSGCSFSLGRGTGSLWVWILALRTSYCNCLFLSAWFGDCEYTSGATVTMSRMGCWISHPAMGRMASHTTSHLTLPIFCPEHATSGC